MFKELGRFPTDGIEIKRSDWQLKKVFGDAAATGMIVLAFEQRPGT